MGRVTSALDVTFGTAGFDRPHGTCTTHDRDPTMAPTIHYRGVRGFVSLAFGTPLSRMGDLPDAAKIGALLAGAGAALFDMRAWLLMLGVLIVTEWLDFWLGSERARRAGDFRDDVARAGRVAKVGGLVLLLIVRAMEALVAMAVPIADTHGALATAAVLALWRSEAQSAEAHMVALGGRGVPVLSRVLSAFGALEALLMPRLPAPPPVPAAEERPS